MYICVSLFSAEPLPLMFLTRRVLRHCVGRGTYIFQYSQFNMLNSIVNGLTANDSNNNIFLLNIISDRLHRINELNLPPALIDYLLYK